MDIKSKSQYKRIMIQKEFSLDEITNKKVPKCRECEFYKYFSQAEEGFRFCKHDDVCTK